MNEDATDTSSIEVEPVVTEVTVPLGAERAFELFTRDIAAWWPTETHAVRGASDTTCVFEGEVGGRIHERTPSGEEADWGRVRVWDPPQRIVFTWHPGRPADTATEVEVTFRPEGDGTSVRLEHRGWEVLDDRAAEVRERYVTGWGMVLGQRYVGAARREATR